MRKVMSGVTIRAMRGAMKSTMRIAVTRAMKRGAVWAGVSVLSLSQASFAAGARDTQRSHAPCLSAAGPGGHCWGRSPAKIKEFTLLRSFHGNL